MVRLIQFVHKTFIIALCLALIAIIMASASHFINRQQTELSGNLQNITHQLIKQSTYSLGPLIHRYNTADDNSQEITDVLQYLTQQPWILDVSVYQLNGALIAQAGESISVRERLELDKNQSISKNTIQLVEKIDLAESPIGFIRLSINPSALQLNESDANYTIQMIWFMIALSVSLGFILALTLSKWRSSSSKRKKKPPEPQNHITAKDAPLIDEPQKESQIKTE